MSHTVWRTATRALLQPERRGAARAAPDLPRLDVRRRGHGPRRPRALRPALPARRRGVEPLSARGPSPRSTRESEEGRGSRVEECGRCMRRQLAARSSSSPPPGCSGSTTAPPPPPPWPGDEAASSAWAGAAEEEGREGGEVSDEGSRDDGGPGGRELPGAAHPLLLPAAPPRRSHLLSRAVLSATAALCREGKGTAGPPALQGGWEREEEREQSRTRRQQAWGRPHKTPASGRVCVVALGPGMDDGTPAQPPLTPPRNA